MEPNAAERIFWEATQRASQDERQQYLDEACAGNANLRRRVEMLLAVQSQAEDFLETPVAAPTVDQPRLERPGTQIGPYKLLQQIGEGGMGTVFMAEQHEPVKRRVALKVIKLGMDTRQVIARFEAERQALSLMDHPNIAKVLDAGTTDSGRPYFVMELVKGQPITQYCDEHHLTPRQRLELLLPVCQAIQHAHQKGIIHRDIKPTNILVAEYDQQPVPKVIDFGVAKATSQTLTEKTMFTGLGQIVGTLEYMSPEQAKVNQLDIDTRSDIYSLGVLLYELLTGSTPFDRKRLRSAAFDEMLRIIREEEPPKPSTRLSDSHDSLPSISAQRRTEPAKLTKLVRGELDWIVMKALDKDRARRYQTASAFAADLQHYLSDEAVQACPPSAGYRIRKYVRRNKGPVLAVSFVLLTLVGGIVGTTWGMMRAEVARRDAVTAQQAETDRAEGERQAKQQALEEKTKAVAAAEAEKKAKETALEREAETRAVLDFVENKVFAAARPKDEDGGMGYDVKLADAVKGSLPFLDQNFTKQPLIEARLRLTIGTSFRLLGKPEVAEKQFLRARELYVAHRGLDHPDTLKSMNNLAENYAALGRLAEALKLHEETLALRKATLGPEHPDTLGSMSNLASSYAALGRNAEAIKLREETLTLQKAQLGPEHPHTLASMSNLASSYDDLGRLAEALKLREETLTLRKAQLGPDHPQTLASMNNLSLSYDALGRHAAALKLREETLPLMKAKLGPEHPHTLRSMNNLANSYANLGRHADALKLREETLAQRKATLGPNHSDTLASMNNLANSYDDLDRHADALKLREETLTLQKAQLGPDHPDTLRSMNNLALSYDDLDRHADALKLREETLTLQKAKLGPDHPDTLRSMNNLAQSYHDLGRHADALKLREETLVLRKATLGPDHPDTLMSMNNLAGSYLARGRHAEALNLFEETLALRKAQLGPDHPDTLTSMHNLALSYAALRRHVEALKLLEETLPLMKARLGPDHPQTLRSMNSLAMSLVNLDRGAEAIPVIDECLKQAAGKVALPWIIPMVMELRLRHFEKSKDAAGCRVTVEMWEKHGRSDANSLYNAACYRAVIAAVIKQDAKTPDADATRLANEEADRAMAWLKQAVAAGYKSATHMKKDKDLDPLRDREDFKKLLESLQTPAAPVTPEKPPAEKEQP